MAEYKALKASGHNNACLFVSLRSGLEIFTVLHKWRTTGARPDYACIDGYHAIMYESAEHLRQMVMTWYEDGLETDLPGFGVYREAVVAAAAEAAPLEPALAAAPDGAATGSATIVLDDSAEPVAAPSGAAASAGPIEAVPADPMVNVPPRPLRVPPTPARNWRRGDLLALEMIRLGRDVPDADGPDRTACMTNYIKNMRRIGVMGGTPEYVAFAFMAKLNIEVYQRTGRRAALKGASGGAANGASPDDAAGGLPPGYFIVNSVAAPMARGTIRLLYNGINHYDLLVAPQDAADILSLWPDSKLRRL